uniref:Dbuz\CG14609a-PA n=1 Tax=Drosophila buzzatii TaxID=7264 RepID=Q4VIT6_DROBU|nr:Dbuz\CG14609a-PA [Drosophila buzzatii]
MPCFNREKSLTHNAHRTKPTDRDPLAPKPVHPQALRFHGLFGMSYVRQHVMVDDRWTPNSLTEEYGGMADLLARRAVFKRHETKANRQRYVLESKRLKLQCRDGRVKLQNILVGESGHTIHNLLDNHKDMQRLYQRMPIDQVVDNINQRTFVMRKERDRLECRLGQLKKTYKEILMKRALLENRIKYQNEYVLDEEVKSRDFIKRIENSNVRLKAVKAINGTYLKMIQVLRHDATFYEPILRSLNGDMEDQANFIKHILYLGMPAIAKFKELNQEYRHLEDKARKNLQAKLQMVSSFKGIRPINSVVLTTHAKPKVEIPHSADPKRYVRETRSMLVLKLVLKSVEKTIEEIKFVTLCSQAKEIYPRMKCQVDNNEKLHRIIECDMLAHEMLETKMKCSNVLKGVLMNNLSEEEINRLELLKDLRKAIAEESEKEQETLKYLKNRGDAFVMLRVSIWNMIEILRHVDRQPKLLRSQYPNSYLKLPLLKFEMLNVRSAAPEIYEENIDIVMHVLKRKLYKLMKGYLMEMKPALIARNRDEYHADFLASHNMFEQVDDNAQNIEYIEDDLLVENKTLADVPSRKHIKMQSVKFLEELAKRDD